MIQDIAPHHYDNAYHPRPPRDGDRVFFYQDTATLLSRATNLPFTWEEAAALADIAKQTGQVIACGGGIVKTQANVHALRQNGCVLWVQRPLGKLATGGRPLSRGGAALKQLQEERTPLYRAAADAVLDNSASLDRVVQEAVQLVDAQPLL